MKTLKYWSLIFILFSTAAVADVVGSWGVGQGNAIKVYYKDDNHIRMDVGNGSYMLIIKDKAYTVVDQGGQKMVMDVDAMGSAMKMMGGMAMQQAKSQIDQYDPESVQYKKTNRTETIAGYKGTVYQVSVKGPKGIETSEMVASNHKDVVTLQKAFHKISQRMAQSIMDKSALDGVNKAADLAAEKGIGGMLRYNQEMTLQSLQNKDLPDEIFQLPKGAVQMSIPSFGQ